MEVEKPKIKRDATINILSFGRYEKLMEIVALYKEKRMRVKGEGKTINFIIHLNVNVLAFSWRKILKYV